jgi:hypothetical protein
MFSRRVLGRGIFIGSLVVSLFTLSDSSAVEQNISTSSAVEQKISTNEENSKITLVSLCDDSTSRDGCMRLDERKSPEKQAINREILNKTPYNTIKPVVNSTGDAQGPERDTNTNGRSFLSSDALALILFVFITSTILIRRLG